MYELFVMIETVFAWDKTELGKLKRYTELKLTIQLECESDQSKNRHQCRSAI